MKEITKIARAEAKALFDKYGVDGLLNKHVTEAQKRTGVDSTTMQNALDYWQYRKVGATK